MKIIQGNLLDFAEQGMFDLIIQGCNCFNTMGGGLAREIKERYPQAYAADCETIRGDRNKLGSWSKSYARYTTRDDNVGNFVILNCYTQYNMSTGKDVFEYVAFQLILQKLLHIYPSKNIGMPAIGTGLAKGDKNVITEMIENFAIEYSNTNGNITLVEFN